MSDLHDRILTLFDDVLFDDVRSKAETISTEARNEGQATAGELHRMSRSIGEKVRAATEAPVRRLILVR